MRAELQGESLPKKLLLALSFNRMISHYKIISASNLSDFKYNRA
jgi:hypothetical protein